MIIEKARELGLALSESQEFQTMLQTRSAVDEDAAIAAQIAAYNEKQETIMHMLEASDADTVAIQALSAEMDGIQSGLMENPVFVKAMEAQNAFQNLMNMVNKEIGACIGAPDEDECEEGCTGSCSTCSGCKH